jgi:hypothetical protein
VGRLMTMRPEKVLLRNVMPETVATCDSSR